MSEATSYPWNVRFCSDVREAVRIGLQSGAKLSHAYDEHQAWAAKRAERLEIQFARREARDCRIDPCSRATRVRLIGWANDLLQIDLNCPWIRQLSSRVPLKPKGAAGAPGFIVGWEVSYREWLYYKNLHELSAPYRAHKKRLRKAIKEKRQRRKKLEAARAAEREVALEAARRERRDDCEEARRQRTEREKAGGTFPQLEASERDEGESLCSP